MVIENIDIYSLIPYQIIDMIEKLNNALSVVKSRKKTISKVAKFEKSITICPHCGSFSIVKNGHTKNGIQTYKCKECSKRFNDLTNTVFSQIHLTYEQIEIFIQCFRDKISLRKTAKRMGVNKNTVYLLRLKIINSLKQIRNNTKLSGEIESDEYYISINLKGTKPDDMPRFSKPRKSKGTTKRGINKHKVCIVSAIDENDNMFFEIAGTGPITSNMVTKCLTSKLKNVSKIITDCKSSYECDSKKYKWNLIQIKSGSYADNNGNNLANINSLHSGLSNFLAHFKGVSTKHLQAYLDWYTFDKYLNYTIDEITQNRTILQKVISLSTEININNMYKNHSGIDFDKVYSDYNYVSSRTN